MGRKIKLYITIFLKYYHFYKKKKQETFIQHNILYYIMYCDTASENLLIVKFGAINPNNASIVNQFFFNFPKSTRTIVKSGRGEGVQSQHSISHCHNSIFDTLAARSLYRVSHDGLTHRRMRR